jgi:Ni/Co efflux regulator RcnB
MEEGPMRKFILASAIAATLLPAGAAMAQSRAEIRHDNREVRQDRRDLDRAYRYGDRHDVRDARHELADSKQERREDWRDYRRAHPDIYRGPAYVAPVRGWSYRPVAVGYRFQPVYYGQRYWVDPVRYRLATPPAYHRWVRYGRDVVLVNTRTGRVVSVNSSFFY